jgi:hypothetical protein
MFIEEKIIGAVKSLLLGAVNDFLGELEVSVPVVEFSDAVSGGAFAITPVIRLVSCERTEKERIIGVDAYAVTISFSVPESDDAERSCYAYSAAVVSALGDDSTLGGAVDRAVLSGKKYAAPKCAGCGDWEVVLSLRLAVEGIA